ncbi:MAG TPA: BrnT family toxin [Roseiarcus sp.]
MEFEFDPEKSSANKAKHGIDFVEAQALWLDEALIEAPARTDDEPRFLVVARISGRHWSAVCVRRGERTRIISARRSRKEEIETYESA